MIVDDAGDPKDGYDNFKYRALTSEYRRQHKIVRIF
jgi:hypothetical protein